MPRSSASLGAGAKIHLRRLTGRKVQAYGRLRWLRRVDLREQPVDGGITSRETVLAAQHRVNHDA
jgi:hypothetical protein